MKGFVSLWVIGFITFHCSAKKFRRQENADGGYQYNTPAEIGVNVMAVTPGLVINQHHMMGESQIDGGHYNFQSQAQVSSEPTAGPVDMEGLAGFAELTKLGASDLTSIPKSDDGSSLTTNVQPTSSITLDTGSLTSHNSNIGTFGDLLGGAGAGAGSGSSDQFTAIEGEVINENPPSIFEYKPRFGGKDINNLPHLLPPSKKSVQELQEEADAKLRKIIAKAKENQNSAIERINKLRQNYGFGTFGFDGFTDTRFKITGNLDLGTHRAIDLGTSIDYTRLKGSNGKLKLPVQNIYHTKTVGIRIPQPYPVKHEVAVPHAIPVPHPVPIPQHHPTSYTPLDDENVIHLTADSLNQSPFSFGFGGGNKPFQFISNGEQPSHSFKGVSSSTFSIEPSQSLGSSSTITDGYGPPEFQPGQPMTEIQAQLQEETPVEPMEMMVTVNTFGLPPGSQSGALTSYNPPSPPLRPAEEYGVPDNAAGSSEGHEVKYGEDMMTMMKLHSTAIPPLGIKFLRLRPRFNKKTN